MSDDDLLTIIGLALGVLGLLLALVAYIDARREANKARRESRELQNRLIAVEQNLLTTLPTAILKLVRTPNDATATGELEDAVAESFQASGRLQDFQDSDGLEGVTDSIRSATGDPGVDLLLPAKKLPRRGPGGYNVVVGTKAHGVWSASRKLDKTFKASCLLETTDGKPFAYEESAEPSPRVVEAVKNKAEGEIVYFTDAWRRKERGSQLWLLRDSNGGGWKVTDANRSGSAHAVPISLT